MNRFKLRWTAVATVAALGTMAACSSSGSNTSAGGSSATSAGGGSATSAGGGSDSVGKIGVSTPVASTPFWDEFSSAVKKDGKDQGLDVLAVVNANSQSSKQVNDIQTMVTQGAKGIVLSPVDSGAISATLNTLESRKIPVVAVNDPPTSGKVAIVVQADNTAFGADQCQAMVKAGITSGSVVNIQGDQSNVAGRQRSDGFEKCMKDKAPGVKVLRVATKWDAQSATNGLQTLLSANRDIKGVAMAAGGAFLPAVMSVLDSKGLLVKRGEPKHVFLTSIDGITLEYKAIADGFEDTVVAQPVDDYAKFGLQYIVKAMKGESFKAGQTDHGSTITESGGYLLDQLPAKIIDDSNLKSVYPGS